MFSARAISSLVIFLPYITSKRLPSSRRVCSRLSGYQWPAGGHPPADLIFRHQNLKFRFIEDTRSAATRSVQYLNALPNHTTDSREELLQFNGAKYRLPTQGEQRLIAAVNCRVNERARLNLTTQHNGKQNLARRPDFLG